MVLAWLNSDFFFGRCCFIKGFLYFFIVIIRVEMIVEIKYKTHFLYFILLHFPRLFITLQTCAMSFILHSP